MARDWIKSLQEEIKVAVAKRDHNQEALAAHLVIIEQNRVNVEMLSKTVADVKEVVAQDEKSVADSKEVLRVAKEKLEREKKREEDARDAQTSRAWVVSAVFLVLYLTLPPPLTYHLHSFEVSRLQWDGIWRFGPRPGDGGMSKGG